MNTAPFRGREDIFYRILEKEEEENFYQQYAEKEEEAGEEKNRVV